MINSDLTFITNEKDKSLLERFKVLIKDCEYFDALVGYFFISGFHRLYPSLEKTDKVRILIGLKTDRTTYELLEKARQQELPLHTHAETKKQMPDRILEEFEAYKHKKRDIQAWKNEKDKKILAFVNGYEDYLDSQIVYEKKKADEGIELRKRGIK